MTKILIDRSTVEQALEALELYVPKEDYENRPVGNVIDALRAALAEPVQEPFLGWLFKRNADGSIGICAPPPKPGESKRTSDCVGTNQKDLNELLGKLADHMAALAEPDSDSPERRCGGPGCDMTCCQPVQEPDNKADSIRWQLCLLAQTDEFSDEVRNQIARGVWLIDKLRAAPSPAEPVEPVAWLTPGQDLHLNNGEGFRFSDWTPLYTAPPQRKPLTEEEIDSIWDSEKAFADIYAIARAVERAHGIGGEHEQR